jgi:hypothetical protein
VIRKNVLLSIRESYLRLSGEMHAQTKRPSGFPVSWAGLIRNNFLCSKFRETLLFDSHLRMGARPLICAGALLWADVAEEVCA